MTPVPNETLAIRTQEPTEAPTPVPLRTTGTPPVAEPAVKPSRVPPVITVANPDPVDDDGTFPEPARPDRDEPEIQKTLYPFDLSYEEDHTPEPIEPEDFPVEEFPAHADDAIDEPAFSPDEEIGLFAEEVRQADPAFTEMTVDDDEMSLSFSRRARLFGLFETGYTDVVRVTPGGSVEVDQPWWLGFAVMDDRKTSSDYAAMFENFDQKTGQLFNILGTAMKTQKEMNSSVVSNMV